MALLGIVGGGEQSSYGTLFSKIYGGGYSPPPTICLCQSRPRLKLFLSSSFCRIASVPSLNNCVCAYVHRRCSDGSRQRSDEVRSAGVLQRSCFGYRGDDHDDGPKQQHLIGRRPLPVDLLQTDTAARRADPVAVVRQGHRPVRLPRYHGQRLRGVVSETAQTVRDRPVEVRERHVRQSSLRRLRRRRVAQQHKRSVSDLPPNRTSTLLNRHNFRVGNFT